MISALRLYIVSAACALQAPKPIKVLKTTSPRKEKGVDGAGEVLNNNFRRRGDEPKQALRYSFCHFAAARTGPRARGVYLGFSLISLVMVGSPVSRWVTARALRARDGDARAARNFYYTGLALRDYNLLRVGTLDLASRPGTGLGLEVVREPSSNSGCCIQRAPAFFPSASVLIH